MFKLRTTKPRLAGIITVGLATESGMALALKLAPPDHRVHDAEPAGLHGARTVVTVAAAPAKKKRRLRRILLLAAISGILAVALAEFGLRIASALVYPALYAIDDELGWRHTTNLQRTLQDVNGRSVQFSTEAHGLRPTSTSPPATAPTRTLLFIGDSFTEASQVNTGESFVGIVASQLADTRCLNAGVGGYSTVQQLLALKTQLTPGQPDMVVLAIYENDFVDNLMPFFSGLGPRPYARLEGEQVSIVTEPDVESFVPYLQPAPSPFWLYRNCAIYRSVHKTIFLRSHGERLAKREQAERSAVPMAAQRTVMSELLRRLRVVARNHGAELRLVALPSRKMVRTKDAPSHDWLATRCQQLDIAYLSLRPALNGHDKTAYFDTDIHFTRHGHELVAGALVPFVRD